MCMLRAVRVEGSAGRTMIKIWVTTVDGLWLRAGFLCAFGRLYE